MLCGATYQTISQILLHRSSEQPNQVAYRFLSDDGAECTEITYSQLDADAQRIAAWMQSANIIGQPVPLIFPAGLEFIRAFFGCLYAGNSAVPLNLPAASESAGRTVGALNDVKSSIVVIASNVRERLNRELAKHSGCIAFEMVTFATTAQNELVWREPDPERDRLALLQYTSGSTSSPKGVEISHRNLLHNIGLISAASKVSSKSVGVSWLPHFHDMGLIGGILMPLYAGFPVTLISPSSFIRHPLRWFETISQAGATVSGAPNFGYEHCLREIAPEDLGSIDLSSWNVAFSGAEPIRPETITRFCGRFGHIGFRKEALFPCYGLAEATLMVSGQHWSEITQEMFSRSALKSGHAKQAASDGDSTSLVSSGSVLEDHQVVIVDVATKTVCEPGTVGEIWVRSESVGRGYWRRPHDTAEVFRAKLPGRPQEEFLRTGDLGFLCRGQLFVTGRQKDLLIIRGTNFYPQEIERSLEAAVPTLRVGFCAAFTIDHNCEEKLVIVYEHEKGAECKLEFDLIVATLVREFGLRVHGIALVRRNRIPRTTSGKIRRQQCRTDFIEGKLPTIAEWRNTAAERSAKDGTDVGEVPSYGAIDSEEVGTLLKRYLAELLGINASTIADSQSILELGIDSLLAAQLQNRIERALKIRLDIVDLLDAETVGEIAIELIEQVNNRRRQRSDDLIGDIFERVLRLSDDEVTRLLSSEEGGAVRG